MTQESMVKEFHKLLKNVSKMSDNQACVSDWNDNDVSTFKIDIKPHGGAYKGGTFTFKVTLCDEFPQEPPQILCETPIYHPNINTVEDYDETNICLNMFQSDMWQEAYGMDGVVQGLLFLFYEPNLENPLSSYFAGDPEDDFENKVLLSLKGEEVDGVKFPWNYEEKNEDEDGDKEENDELTKSEENGNESRNDNSVGKPEETRNDDSVEETEETKSDIVPKSDDVAKDVDDVSERNEDEDGEKEEGQVLLSLNGEEVDGVKFPWNYEEKNEDEDGDKEENDELTKSEENGNEIRNDNPTLNVLCLPILKKMMSWVILRIRCSCL